MSDHSSNSAAAAPELREQLGTHQKALRINIDQSIYGTFAEIGAGQEVARWFFRVGGAAGTMAKAMSAYDMTFSDAIYGPSDRYVSRQRLETMLQHEFGLLVERLNEKRGKSTKFFAYADTCATRSFTRKVDGDGWLGIRYQTEPMTDPSDIIVHCRLRDDEAVLQQEALGILGVNLVHAASYHFEDPRELLLLLMDGLSSKRIEIDVVEFSGPVFADVDNRLIALMLVENGLCDAAMFLANGEVVQPSEVLYKKSILIERGSFRPVTNVTVDMLRCAKAQFVQEPKVQGEEVITLLEMTLKNLSDGAKIDHQDFLDRVDILRTLGHPVLISNFAEYHRLAAYLFRYTRKMIGVVMGVPTLKAIFDEKYYTDLEGGILESFGRLFKNDLKFYVYPLLEEGSGALISATNLRVAPNLRHLHAFLVENRLIESLRDYSSQCLSVFSRQVLAKLQSGDASWETEVPPQVARIIKERGLLGFGDGNAAGRKASQAA
ncbi:MAG TPA: nicotinate-nucleotide adenylyltransferase [Verrucomicrobiales bacterium]|nr:nicotinate-nucleotide adenylyltransferase [Verrucomicrobiales bacterium]